MRHVRDTRIPPQPIATPEYAWRVWRTWRGCRVVAGDYRTHREAELGKTQLAKIRPDSRLEIEFIGRPIAHTGDGGRPL